MEIFKYGNIEIEYLKSKDKKLGELIDRIGIIERETDSDLFKALIKSIVGQQISNKAAATVWRRFTEKFNSVTPQMIFNTSAEDIQKCGISMKKALYIKSLADTIEAGGLDLEELKNMKDEEVCAKLCSIKGIGVWTAEMLMIFSMGRLDVLSYGDLAIRRGLMKLYHHKTMDKTRFNRYKKRYSPYGSVASLYLWALSAEG
ncbi:DNA-3-methyladenine glycosylase family protein [Clostridium polynesiense]|uniref:DNA-3-methyladenine glycosylase family protein n=1 Tax=Clostridium polynesiense TaxID=1325933 RepID=UPI00058F40CF|nr:DNA-3-methyladenine glycosylase [Clostridium polynesiense]